MRFRDYFGLALPLVVLSVVSCSDSDAPQRPAACSGEVALSVTMIGTNPRFDWTPRCAAAGLVITAGPSTGILDPFYNWIVDGDSAVIVPPVNYGVLPNGARSSGAAGLRSTMSYRIDLYRLPRALGLIAYSGWQQP